MKKRIAFVLVLSLVFSLMGCSKSPAAAEPTTSTVVFTDDCGREGSAPFE